MKKGGKIEIIQIKIQYFIKKLTKKRYIKIDTNKIQIYIQIATALKKLYRLNYSSTHARI